MRYNTEKMFLTRDSGPELGIENAIKRVENVERGPVRSCQYVSADLWVPRVSSTLPPRPRDITATFHQLYSPAINNRARALFVDFPPRSSWIEPNRVRAQTTAKSYVGFSISVFLMIYPEETAPEYRFLLSSLPPPPK